jgi:glyoxylase-like metal-dependent hydrolase (beta-lactamase superfamily II)
VSARLRTIVDSEFGLDGGAMMGVVPRVLWEKAHPPDAQHRIRLVSRFALVEDPAAGRLWLLDAGFGRDWTPKLRTIYDLRPRGTDVRELVRSAGADPDAVTDVVLTHLHFDHAGGIVRREEDGRPALSFPRAAHHLQASQWAWAQAPSAKDAGSFRADHVAALGESGRLALVDGARTLGGAVAVRVVNGHSPGMQLPLVEAEGGPFLFLADLVPVWSHLRLPWVMAYDNEPVATIEEKRHLLAEAAERRWTLVSEHDASAPRATVRAVDGGGFEATTFSTADDMDGGRG